MIKVLLVGGGGREHAIAHAVKRSEDAELYCVMKNRNPGIIRLCREYKLINESDVKAAADYAAEKKIELAVIGPEAPLVNGIADELEKLGILCAGPKKALARIEGDKAFARGLLEKYKIPCNLNFRVFDQEKDAVEYINRIDFEAAVKPCGLTGGKGVKVMGEHLKSREEAREYVKEIFSQKIGGGSVVIEEKAYGEEFTVQALCDGRNIFPMPCVQDHKRAFENDRGHNTGGMGSYSDSDFLLPFLTRKDYEKALNVMEKTIKALKKETGEEYKGILYGQFMAGKELKLIEFNCRFGDPEAMNVLSIIREDFLELCAGAASGKMKKTSFSSLGKYFEEKATVCKYVVPKGYGVDSKGGEEIFVDAEKIAEKGALVYYAAVNEEDGKILTTSSRAVGIVGIDKNIEGAERVCKEAISFVRGNNIYHRSDIGKRWLIDKKVSNVKSLRGN